MEDNRYQSSKSGRDKSPGNQEPGSLLKAVLLGVATDIGGTIVIGLVFGTVYGILLASQGQSAEQIQKSLENVDPSSALGIISFLSGLVMSVLSGYVCARSANTNSYTAVGILSAISVAFGTVLGIDAYDGTTLLMLNLLGLAAIFFGGWWYIRTLVGAGR